MDIGRHKEKMWYGQTMEAVCKLYLLLAQNHIIYCSEVANLDCGLHLLGRTRLTSGDLHSAAPSSPADDLSLSHQQVISDPDQHTATHSYLAVVHLAVACPLPIAR